MPRAKRILAPAPKPVPRNDLLIAQEAGRELAYWTERLAVLSTVAASARGASDALGFAEDEHPTLEDLTRRESVFLDVLVDALAREARGTFRSLADFRERVP